jgi:glycosyltransferase involved in cell wall biosynthesis
VTHTLAIGGAPKSLLYVATTLRIQGFEPLLYYSKEGPLKTVFTAAALSCRHVPKQKGLLGLHLGFIYQILRRYRRDGIQLVFLNCLVPYYKYHALAACLMGLPVIWSIRENVRSKRAQRLLGWLQRLATLVMPCSGEIAAQLRLQGVSAPMRVVHNGIDVEASNGVEPFLLRRQLQIPADHWVVGCVGSLERRKGQLDLVAAAAMLDPEEGPLAVVLIGAPGAKGDADPYLRELQRAAARLPEHVKVHFYGARRDIRALYSELDVVCLPSYWEGSSRTILETMRARSPLLTTTAGGNPEMVRHMESAYLVSPGDRRALAEGLRFLKRDPIAAAGLAKAAFTELEREFTLAHYQQRVGAVIDAVFG